MEDQYGSDFITIVDEDGTEFELEVLLTAEYNGYSYKAVTLAGAEEDQDIEISILKVVEEDGEEILCAIEDEKELAANGHGLGAVYLFGGCGGGLPS